jgi:DNA replication ATP-dependent helicase Dna2
VQETILEILEGIDQELLESAKFHRFKVSGVSRKGNIWQLTVDPLGSRSALDESLEGAAAWWKGPPTGAADVLSIVPDTDQINIRFLTNPPPQTGEEVRIYPPRYLEALRECWEFSPWASTCMQWHQQLDGKIAGELPNRNRIDAFPKLRKAQRQVRLTGPRRWIFVGSARNRKNVHTGCNRKRFSLREPSRPGIRADI